MNLRRYNIYFHTHTISGIFICAILYVIFFAGSFSFFRSEIIAWQKNESDNVGSLVHSGFDTLLDSLGRTKNLTGRDIAFYMQRNGHSASVNVSVSKDSVVANEAARNAPTGKEAKRGGHGRGARGDAVYFTYDFAKKKSLDGREGYTLGEFLYRLHFLAQLNQIGINIGTPFGYAVAGLVSFMFLFALITGLLLHWDKIKSNFFIFRPWNKWKTVWTDMHTAMGVIGFPYQFMYALTGIIFCCDSLLIIPFSQYMYNGDSKEIYAGLGYNDNKEYAYLYSPIHSDFKVGVLLDGLSEKWPNSHIDRIFINNYGDKSMHVTAMYTANIDKNFAGAGKMIYRVADKKILFEKSANEKGSYMDYIKGFIYRLHYGDFGGYPVKIIYFVLGIMGCLIIISGILIWLVARDKNNVPKHKRIFNFWASNVFLAICLSMLPVTASTFIVIKLADQVDRSLIYSVYFYGWLALSVFYTIRHNMRRTNLETLLLGVILSFAIPIVNGIKTGKWIWVTYGSGEHDIMLVDMLWLSIGIVGLLVWLRILKDGYKKTTKEKEEKVDLCRA